MKRSVLMKLTACCMTGAMVLGSTGVVTMASGLDSALAGMGAEITESQQTKEVVKVAPSGYDTVAIAQVDEYVNIRDAASTAHGSMRIRESRSRSLTLKKVEPKLPPLIRI